MILPCSFSRLFRHGSIQHSRYPLRQLFGGLERSDKAARVPLVHGDVFVWGGPARLRFHGIAPLKDGSHPATGACRLNLTLRKAG